MRGVIIVGLALAVAAPQLPLVAQATRSISAGDKATGAKANPELLEQYGGAYQGPQVAYVDRVGKRVAVQSGLSNASTDFTITLLNSPVENAFAIPGGYVYVTRQLLALMNSESELAAVLGHEIGHVAANHAAKRNARATIGSILAAGIGAVTGSNLVGQVASTGTQLYTLGFSRGQEYQADGLGVRYADMAGYSPYAMASVLSQLSNDTMLAQRIAGQTRSIPTWASTHPNDAQRIARARALAQATGKVQPGSVQDVTFLRMLDGLRYDDDPAQGVIDGQTFKHAGLRIAFTAPAGYTLSNGADAVTIAGTAGQASFTMAAPTNDLAGFISARFAQLGGNGANPEIRQSGDVASATVGASANGQPVDVSIVAFRRAAATYSFTLITARGSGVGPFQSMIDSFRTLSAEEAGRIRGKVVRIVTVARGDTVDSLAKRMAYTDFQRERFVTLNGLDADAKLTPGRLVKIVVAE